MAAALVLSGLSAVPALASTAGSEQRVVAVVRVSAGPLSVRGGLSSVAPGRAARWRRQPGVVAAAVDHRIRITGTPDPMQGEQWGLTTLHATSAWITGDGTGQVVGVVDTGVDASHPDLAGAVLPGTDVVDGGDGRIDPNGHGTHVAGIVAAVSGNGIGGAGLATGARVLPVRVIGADGSGWDSDAAAGLVWAADHGATVVNMSFGGPDRSPVMEQAVGYALGKGVSVVVAAGNEGASGDPVEYPAATPGVIAVGAVDVNGFRPAWSSSGSHLAVAAPGVGIFSTVPGGGYATWSGTSMAAPFVSAAVALLRRAQPVLTPAAVRQRLVETADDLGPVGFDPQYGAGRLNLLAAEAVPAPVDVTTTPPVMTARISASRTTTPYVGAVTVSGRVLADGLGTPGIPVRLERQVGASWVETRVGTSGLGGLASWVIRPDRTTYYRFVGAGWSSPLLRIAVTPVVSLTARTTGLTGRVLPGRVTTVRIDVHRATGWVTLTWVTSAADGTYRLARAFTAGSYVRTVVLGAVSPTTRVT
jgi:subtilisin family serine protease